MSTKLIAAGAIGASVIAGTVVLVVVLTSPDAPEEVLLHRTNCSTLVNTNYGVWEPASCVEDYSEVNDSCTIQCKEEAELSGGREVNCMEEGWVGINGLYKIPQCKGIPDIGEEFIDRIRNTLEGKPANMIFLLDESKSVASKEFYLEVQFIKALVAAFPLSSERSAGVITFSSGANVDIRLNTPDTCLFMKQADTIRYTSGGTDILKALRLAISEIASYGVHDFTIVFLITDGESQTNPQVPADEIKNSGSVLFTVGVANYSPAQLIPLSSLDEEGDPIFFPIRDFEIFRKVASYLETTYSHGQLNC